MSEIRWDNYPISPISHPWAGDRQSPLTSAAGYTGWPARPVIGHPVPGRGQWAVPTVPTRGEWAVAQELGSGVIYGDDRA